jgi:hypothetical protein
MEKGVKYHFPQAELSLEILSYLRVKIIELEERVRRLEEKVDCHGEISSGHFYEPV